MECNEVGMSYQISSKIVRNMAKTGYMYICPEESHYSALHTNISTLMVIQLSVYFMFIIDDMIERNSVSVTLHDVDLSALCQLIDYAYTGEISITEENVQVILERNNHICWWLRLDLIHSFERGNVLSGSRATDVAKHTENSYHLRRGKTSQIAHFWHVWRDVARKRIEILLWNDWGTPS